MLLVFFAVGCIKVMFQLELVLPGETSLLAEMWSSQDFHRNLVHFLNTDKCLHFRHQKHKWRTLRLAIQLILNWKSLFFFLWYPFFIRTSCSFAKGWADRRVSLVGYRNLKRNILSFPNSLQEDYCSLARWTAVPYIEYRNSTSVFSRVIMYQVDI